MVWTPLSSMYSSYLWIHNYLSSTSKQHQWSMAASVIVVIGLLLTKQRKDPLSIACSGHTIMDLRSFVLIRNESYLYYNVLLQCNREEVKTTIFLLLLLQVGVDIKSNQKQSKRSSRTTTTNNQQSREDFFLSKVFRNKQNQKNNIY